MIGRALLTVAEQPVVARFVRESRLTRGVVNRFVAGETLDDALAVARDLNERGIRVSLDHLGENTRDEAEARTAAESYVAALDGIRRAGVEATVSLKLTALGLDLGEAPCRRGLERVLSRAGALGGIFVRVDMEGSSYVGRTLALVRDLHRTHPYVGTVLQAYLYRTRDDLETLIDERVRVRLVKGAYAEPSSIAYPRKRDTDRNYLRLMEQLLREGDYPALATHDEALITHARSYAARKGIGKSAFEFQMLYGVRQDLQEALARDGYNVRAYVPYGSQWYPYLTRRLAERPANVLFVASNLRR
ncbi:MAG: proline dehydrogenase [Chloroflexota bacterium]